MNMFRRLRDLTVASVHGVLDSLEDPVVMLNHYMREMEMEIARAEVAVARQVASEKRFRQQWEEAAQMAEKRERQAELALAQGEDELARRALIDKKFYEARAREFEQLSATAREAAEQMREKLAELKNEFYNLRAKKYALVSRAQVARTRKHLNRMIAGFGCESAVKGFSRMEEKVIRWETEAELSDEWRKWKSGADPHIHDIDAELAALKARLAGQKNGDSRSATGE